MKSERSKQFIDNDAIVMRNGDRMVDASTAYMAIELAEQEAEERMRDELTRWRDPKEDLPEGNTNVIIRYLADKEGICTGCYNLKKERWELNDMYLSHLSYKVHIHVLAWRPIHE